MGWRYLPLPWPLFIPSLPLPLSWPVAAVLVDVVAGLAVVVELAVLAAAAVVGELVVVVAGVD